MSLTFNEQQVKKLAVGLQGAANCLLTVARTLTTNSLENEKEEQRDLDLLKEFNSGDLKGFLLRYVENLVENDVVFKNYENISSSSGHSRGSKKDKGQQNSDVKDFVLQYFNSLIENDPMLRSFLKPGVFDSRKSATNRSSFSTSRSGKSKSKVPVNYSENEALMELEELTKPITASSKNSIHNKNNSSENGSKKKRNRIKKPVDPNAPKKPVSAFLLYQKDVQDDIRKEFPDTKWNDILRMISHRWQSLPNEEKKEYDAKLQQARQNYEIEYKLYIENKDNSSSNVIGIADDGKEIASSSKSSGKKSLNDLQDYTDEEEGDQESDNDSDDNANNNNEEDYDNNDEEDSEDSEEEENESEDTVDEDAPSAKSANKSSSRKMGDTTPRNSAVDVSNNNSSSSSNGGSDGMTKKRKEVTIDESDEKSKGSTKKSKKEKNNFSIKGDDDDDVDLTKKKKSHGSSIKTEEDDNHRPVVILDNDKHLNNNDGPYKLSSNNKSKDKKKKKSKESSSITGKS